MSSTAEPSGGVVIWAESAEACIQSRAPSAPGPLAL